MNFASKAKPSVLVGLLLTVFLSSAAQSAVFGFDNRVELISQSSPWRSIGIFLRSIRRNDGGLVPVFQCTATLISENLILTAAHCLGGATKSVVYQFAPNYGAVDRSNQENWAEATTVASGYALESGDWAVLRLSKPLGKRFGHIKVAKFDFTRILPPAPTELFSKKFFNKNPFGVSPVTVAGYPEKLTLHVHADCAQLIAAENSVFPNATQTINSYCDLTPGQSGGPIILVNNGQPLIVALISSKQLGLQLQLGNEDRNWLPIDNLSVNKFTGLYFVADLIEKLIAENSTPAS